DSGTLYGLAMIFGVAYGSVMPLYAVVTREYFGERAMGTAYGGGFLISCLGMGLGAYAGGVLPHLLRSFPLPSLPPRPLPPRGPGAAATMAFVMALTLRPPTRAVRPA